MQSQKKLADQKSKRERVRERNQLTALPCFNFCVLLWGSKSQREERERERERERLYHPPPIVIVVPTPEVVTPILAKNVISSPSLSLIYLSGTFLISEGLKLKADQLLLLFHRLSPLFQRDSSSSFRRIGFSFA